MSNTWIFALAALALFQASPTAAQELGDATVLTVVGDVERPLKFTDAGLRGLVRTSVEIEEKGVTRIYEGVWLQELLIKAGTPRGDQIRGKVLSTCVLASARDGYHAVFALAELDPGFRDETVLLADTVDGGPLPADVGPFRLIALGDRRGARSVRMLERIEVLQLRK